MVVATDDLEEVVKDVDYVKHQRCSCCGDPLPLHDELREYFKLKLKHDGEYKLRWCELKYANGELCEYCAFNDD